MVQLTSWWIEEKTWTRRNQGKIQPPRTDPQCLASSNQPPAPQFHHFPMGYPNSNSIIWSNHWLLSELSLSNHFWPHPNRHTQKCALLISQLFSIQSNWQSRWTITGTLKVRLNFESYSGDFQLCGFGHHLHLFSWLPTGLLWGSNAAIDAYEGLCRVLGLQPAQLLLLLQGGWSWWTVVYKHALSAFQSVFKTRLLIVNGMSLGTLFLKYHF